MEWKEDLIDKLDRFSKQKCAMEETSEIKNAYQISAVLKKNSGNEKQQIK